MFGDDVDYEKGSKGSQRLFEDVERSDALGSGILQFVDQRGNQQIVPEDGIGDIFWPTDPTLLSLAFRIFQTARSFDVCVVNLRTMRSDGHEFLSLRLNLSSHRRDDGVGVRNEGMWISYDFFVVVVLLLLIAGSLDRSLGLSLYGLVDVLRCS